MSNKKKRIINDANLSNPKSEQPPKSDGSNNQVASSQSQIGSKPNKPHSGTSSSVPTRPNNSSSSPNNSSNSTPDLSDNKKPVTGGSNRPSPHSGNNSDGSNNKHTTSPSTGGSPSNNSNFGNGDNSNSTSNKPNSPNSPNNSNTPDSNSNDKSAPNNNSNGDFKKPNDSNSENGGVGSVPTNEQNGKSGDSKPDSNNGGNNNNSSKGRATPNDQGIEPTTPNNPNNNNNGGEPNQNGERPSSNDGRPSPNNNSPLNQSPSNDSNINPKSSAKVPPSIKPSNHSDGDGNSKMGNAIGRPLNSSAPSDNDPSDNSSGSRGLSGRPQRDHNPSQDQNSDKSDSPSNKSQSGDNPNNDDSSNPNDFVGDPTDSDLENDSYKPYTDFEEGVTSLSKSKSSTEKKRRRLLLKIGVPSLLILSIIASATGSLIGSMSVVVDEEENTAAGCENTSKGKGDSSSSSSQSGNSVGSWTTPGTNEYEVASGIFDHLTQYYGTSGAFASGVLANVAGESAFIPDRLEGPGVLRFGMNNKIPPVPGGPGGGLFQFTPYSVFTDSSFWAKVPGSDGWDPRNQVEAMWSIGFSDRNVWRYASSTNPSYGAAHYGMSVKYKSLEEWLETDDPAEASKAFQVGYERPAVYHPEREEAARLADSIFNKDNVKARPDVYNKHISGGGNGDPVGGSTGDSVSNGRGGKNKGCSVNKKGTGSEDIVKTAEDYLDYFQYDLDHSLAAFKDWDNPPRGAVTDCSGFVWFILHKTGVYNVPPAMGWFTGSMEADAKGAKHYLEAVDKESAKAGDIVIANLGGGAGADGHTGILQEDWHGPDTKVIHHGSGWGGQITEFKYAFGRFDTYDQSKVSITFASAVKKDKKDDSKDKKDDKKDDKK